MPQVVRGSHAGLDEPTAPNTNTRTSSTAETDSPQQALGRRHSEPAHDEGGTRQRSDILETQRSHTSEQGVTTGNAASDQHRHVAFRADSHERDFSPHPISRDRRRSSSFFRNNSEDRPPADAYYDSRAATKREWRRRATTLGEYYHDNPELLPQLPFTWHRGKKRWRLILLITLMWIDACVLPIALYYGMHYGGVAGWIIFAIVTTIWGGPTYLEFGIRTLKLIKKERFYRPLGTTSRWCFDYLTWVSVCTITAVTTLFIVGSAPHIVWLRVLCMPMPALLYCLGILVGLPTLYSYRGWKAPFRLSSTAKGEEVKPGVYYIIEDTVAVNANAGRPYREALAARYDASPRFRRMIFIQSVFWTIPPIIIAIPLTVIAVIHPVPPNVAYAICWAVPFIWATVWGLITLKWCKRDMVRERLEWENTRGPLAAKIRDATGAETDRSSVTPPSGNPPQSAGNDEAAKQDSVVPDGPDTKQSHPVQTV